jgi:uncharacterized membrane protein YpjA
MAVTYILEPQETGGLVTHDYWFLKISHFQVAQQCHVMMPTFHVLAARRSLPHLDN